MAVIYLRSTDGSDADNGSTWALAKATLAAALTAAGAGGTVYVSDNHAESAAAAKTLTSPGTAASPVRVICVDDSGNPEPPTARATTASVTTTGNNGITFAGFAYYYGITFSAGTGNSAAATIAFQSNSPWAHFFDTCSLQCPATNAASKFLFGNTSTTVDDNLCVLHNTTFKFGATGQFILVRCPVRWQFSSGLAAGGSTPAVLFQTPAASAPYALMDLIGVDLSELTGTLVTVGQCFDIYRFRDCKLGSGVTFSTGTYGGPGATEIEVINCDSGDTSYRYHFENYMGTITSETTIVRMGGASDGTTAFSRKMVSTANTKFYTPLRARALEFWNTKLSSQTVSIPILTDNVTLKDDECWAEVEYLGTSGFPLGSLASDQVADPIFGTAANQATDSSSSWASAPGTPVQQTLDVTFTPAEVGLIRVWVCLAKPTTTLYFDPKVSNGKQYMSGAGIVNEPPVSPIFGGAII